MDHSGTVYERLNALLVNAGMEPVPLPESSAEWGRLPLVMMVHLLYQLYLLQECNNSLLAQLAEHFTGEEFVNLNHEPNGEV